MKKFFALMLAAMFVLCAASALAATDVLLDTGMSIDIRFTSEEDIETEVIAVDGACLILFGDARNADDPNNLQVFATVASTEEETFEGRAVTSATSDRELEGLFRYDVGALKDDSENPYTYTIHETPDGIRALVIMDEELRDEIRLLTLHDGLFIHVFGFYPDFHAVTDEDIAYVTGMLDSFSYEASTDEVVLDGVGGVVEAAE